MRRITLLPALLLALFLGATATWADSGVKLTFSGVSGASITTTDGVNVPSGITVTVTDLSTNAEASGVTATLDAVSFTAFNTTSGGTAVSAGTLLEPAANSGYANSNSEKTSTITYTFGLSGLSGTFNEIDLGVCGVNAGGNYHVESSSSRSATPFSFDVYCSSTNDFSDLTASTVTHLTTSYATVDDSIAYFNVYADNTAKNYQTVHVKSDEDIDAANMAYMHIVFTKITTEQSYAGLQDVEILNIEEPTKAFTFHNVLPFTESEMTGGSNTNRIPLHTSSITQTVSDAGTFTLSNPYTNICRVGWGTYNDELLLRTGGGTMTESTYTIAAPAGCYVTGYTITGYAYSSDVIATAANGTTTTTFSNSSTGGTEQTLSVSGLTEQTSTSFTLSGTADTYLAAKIAFTYEQYEIPDPDDTFDFHDELTTSGSSSYAIQATESVTDVGDFTLSASENVISKTGQELNGDAYYLGLYIGSNSTSMTYTITAPTGYNITSYTITGFALSSSNTIKVTAADGTKTTTFSSQTETSKLEVTGLSDTYTTFTLSGTKSTGIGAKIAFTYEKSAEEAPTSYTVTIPEGGGYVTACFPYAVQVPVTSFVQEVSSSASATITSPDGLMIYTASLSDEGTSLELVPPIADDGSYGYEIARYQIPAGTPVVLGGLAGSYELTVVSSATSLGDNVLTGNSGATAVTPTTDVYVLGKSTEGVQQFVKVAANTTDGIPAYSAYYAPSTATADALTLSTDYFCQTYDSKTLWFHFCDEEDYAGTVEVVNPDYYRYKEAYDAGSTSKAEETRSFITPYKTYEDSPTYILPETITFAGTTYTVSGLGDLAFRGFLNKNGYAAIEGTDCTVSMPNSYTHIGPHAFDVCCINSLVLPDDLKSIGIRAFASTGYLNSIEIPSGVTELPTEAFFGSGISSITLPSTLTKIGIGAFYDTYSLSEITIPASVKTICAGAFYDESQSFSGFSKIIRMEERNDPCTVELAAETGPKSDGNTVIYDAFSTKTHKVIVPTDCSQYYKTNASSTGWSYYTSIIREEVNIRKPKWDDDYGAKHYATLSLSEPFTVPKGLTAGIPYAASNGALSIDWFGTEGTVVKANTPVILYGTSSTTPFYYVATTTADATDATAGEHESENMLKGYTDYDENTTYTTIDPETATSGKKVYVMTYGEELKSDGLGNVTTEEGEHKYEFGFYWDANTKDKGYTARCPRYKAVLISDVAATGPTAPSTSSVRGKARAAAATTEGKGFPLTYEEQRVSQDVTLGETGYATLYHRYALVVPQGITASTVTADGDQLTLNAEFQSGDIVPAYTPVVLQGEPGTYTFKFTVGGTRPAANDLHGTLKDSLLTGEGKYYKLSLSKDGQNVGFYYGGYQGRGFFNAGGKAYLYVNPATASTRGYALDEATTTAISSARTEDGDAQAGATRNGQATYDLQGRRVAQPGRGLYIMGGKKVIIR